jgi:hypothetical protein
LLAVAARERRTAHAGLLYWYVDVPLPTEASLPFIVLSSEEDSAAPFFSTEEDRRRVPLRPATRREFSRSDVLRVSLPPDLDGVIARVLDERGSVVLAARASERERELRLALFELPLGQYFLELSAGDRSRRTMPFQVESDSAIELR